MRTRASTSTRGTVSDRYHEDFAERGLLVALEGPRLLLRTICMADAPRLCELLQDAEVTRFFPWTPPRDVEETREYVLGFQHEIHRQSAYHLTILLRPGGEPIGVCNLYHLHPGRREAEVGIWLGRPYWGQRYQADVNRLLMRYAFEVLGFRRLLYRVAAGNLRARRAFESLGARPIGHVGLYSCRLHADMEHIVYALEEDTPRSEPPPAANSHRE